MLKLLQSKMCFPKYFMNTNCVLAYLFLKFIVFFLAGIRDLSGEITFYVHCAPLIPLQDEDLLVSFYFHTLV